MQAERLKTAHRGAAENPPNRFEHTAYERDADWDQPDDPAPKTRFYRDASVSIITYNDSPDIGFGASINPYRGCEHGCTYHLIIPRYSIEPACPFCSICPSNCWTGSTFAV
jgi:hypothetical protein